MYAFRKLICIAALVGCPSFALAQPDSPETPIFLECPFSPTSIHPFFPFAPGDQKILEGMEDGQQVSLLWEVLNETKEITLSILGETKVVRCAVIREEHRVDGEVEEISWNYFAQCKSTGSVYYFGEEVDIYEDGEVVNHDGAWLAGEDLNEPGVIMPGKFVPGEIYFQEFAPGQAEDLAENKWVLDSYNVPAGSFAEVIEIWEYSPLEPDAEPSIKHYARGLGLLTDAPLTLSHFTSAPRLQLERAIKLSWSSLDESLVVEAGPTPEGPWDRMDTPVSSVNEAGEREVWIATDNKHQFFRLVTP